MLKRIIMALFVASVFQLAFIPSLFSAEKTLKIAMMQWRGETDGCRGFRDGLKELGYAVTYTDLNAGQNKEELGRLIREALLANLEHFDYVYSFGTTVSKATKLVLRNRVPHVFNIVSAPVEAGLVPSLDKPGGNISGATNAVPVEVQLEAALQLFPFQRLGLLFNSREKNSMIHRQQLHDAAKKLDIEVIDLRSPPAQDALEENLRKLIDRTVAVDAVFLPRDTYIFTQAKRISVKLKAANIKTIGSLDRYIQDGALIGIVPDYYALGKAAASIVDRHQKGEKLQNIPVQRDRKPRLMINKTTANALQVKIPEPLLKKAIFVE